MLDLFSSDVNEVHMDPQSERCFPDMPVLLRMTQVRSNYLLFQLESKKWLLPMDEFKTAIYRGSTSFFTNLIHCFGTQHTQFPQWDAELKRVKQQTKIYGIPYSTFEQGE
ncbi:hypothetical protein [Desmospora activa]|uniref:hypothetical protein n=1 Tax=Desmospora activa TaxID=500615 RepID=UPI000D30B0C1|nr:hypothetical protein [Desmospora activa]